MPIKNIFQYGQYSIDYCNHILGEITPELPIHFPVYYTEINLGFEIIPWENFELKSTVGKFDLTS